MIKKFSMLSTDALDNLFYIHFMKNNKVSQKLA